MLGRRFWTETVSIERGSKANASGTLQPIVTYSQVSGMSSLEAAILHSSSNAMSSVLGELSGEMWEIKLNPEQFPSGEVIKEGDRIKKSDTGETFTVITAHLVWDSRARVWDLTCTRKTA